MEDNPSNFSGNLQRPVERVNWNECQEFLSKLNALTGEQFRLPTEAEWEYAARGGAKSRGYKYSGSNTLSDVAWYEENAYNVEGGIDDYGTHQVGTKSANELGIYDMSGKVWEWCNDLYGAYNSDDQTNPKGASKGNIRLFRGGGWGSTESECAVTYRNYATPNVRNINIGLRIAL